MEARGYQGGEGRTKYRQLYWKIADSLADGVFSACNDPTIFITFIMER